MLWCHDISLLTELLEEHTSLEIICESSPSILWDRRIFHHICLRHTTDSQEVADSHRTPKESGLSFIFFFSRFRSYGCGEIFLFFMVFSFWLYLPMLILNVSGPYCCPGWFVAMVVIEASFSRLIGDSGSLRLVWGVGSPWVALNGWLLRLKFWVVTSYVSPELFAVYGCQEWMNTWVVVNS